MDLLNHRIVAYFSCVKKQLCYGLYLKQGSQMCKYEGRKSVCSLWTHGFSAAVMTTVVSLATGLFLFSRSNVLLHMRLHQQTWDQSANASGRKKARKFISWSIIWFLHSAQVLRSGLGAVVNFSMAKTFDKRSQRESCSRNKSLKHKLLNPWQH